MHRHITSGGAVEPTGRHRCATRPTEGRACWSEEGIQASSGLARENCAQDTYDGLRVDVHGNLWLSAGDGVHCHASDGSLLGKLLIPEAVSNVCFGGPKLNQLFVRATTSLYSVFLNTRGTLRR